MISIDGNLVAGDSGGPILDSAGEVCGVIDGGLLGGAAAISWAIPLGAPIGGKLEPLKRIF